ncbi:acyl-CoA dehydrogenase C-terminal domain-containing protein [Cellvibrio sp. OA-2007]|uniref:acyl-CoA dehydrogenase C-terminal domain-containing protein n=1 Tax=Cellvibrio sp. OA-2007 TaxID=529823 RepID=UPI000782C3B2|nr:acyl-CoA dehydrogenase C-terminal domain-containing protein [Cellvibrio sp. OA-2007]
MNNYRTPLRDIDFTLFELFKYEQHCGAIGHASVDRELTGAFLGEAARFAEEVLAPLGPVGDQQGCKLIDGNVVTPSGFKQAYQQYCDAGWPTLSRSTAYGGQGLPQSLGVILSEIIGTPNWAWGMYAGLSQGAMHTIEIHGTEQQKQQYLPALISGRWTGTMCLTEAHAGSDLGLLRTRAEPQPDGSYLITGTKIFISSGDHDLAENIVHIVLARLPDAPAGTKGISLFVVPKIQLKDDGSLASVNGVSCSSLEDKMGIHGNATCVLQFEGAKGCLLGEVNKGLNHMFTFMNLARIGSGLQGLAHAEFGYQQARLYARERLQMRSLSGVKNTAGPADPIIVHPDIRRMLLTQKSLVEGIRMLSYYASIKMDVSQHSTDADERQQAVDLLGLLTPIVKAFSTEAGFESANLALQCLGGHGYIRDWGLEQNLRDCRIATLYEGTTGIQALDLLGRKVLGAGGKTLAPLIDEITQLCRSCDDTEQLAAHAAQLATLSEEWQQLSMHIARQAQQNPDEIGAAAVDYLMCSGYLVVAFLWLKAQQVALRQLAQPVADPGFYRAKLAAAEFYFARILPRTMGLIKAMESGADNLMSLASADF